MTQGSFVCGRDLFNEEQLIYYMQDLRIPLFCTTNFPVCETRTLCFQTHFI